MKKITFLFVAVAIFSIASSANAQYGGGFPVIISPLSTGHSSSGGGGGSTGSTQAAVVASAPVGKVLGAATVHFSAPVRQGATGETVSSLQERLRAEGFFTYPTSTGFFGPITLAAVKAYQAAHGLPATGFVGPLTIKALNS